MELEDILEIIKFMSDIHYESYLKLKCGGGGGEYFDWWNEGAQLC